MFALFSLVNNRRGDTFFATSCEWDNDLFARLWGNEGSGWQVIPLLGLTVPTFSLCGSIDFRGPKGENGRNLSGFLTGWPLLQEQSQRGRGRCHIPPSSRRGGSSAAPHGERF